MADQPVASVRLSEVKQEADADELARMSSDLQQIVARFQLV